MNPINTKLSLGFLFIVAIIGTILRSAQLIPIPLEYGHLVHAHSHVAFQGWVYTVLFLLLIQLYLSNKQITKGRYPLQFKLTIVLIIGVLISFSLQGYALYSILFSTLFQGMNYWFFYRFIRDSKSNLKESKTSISLQFIHTGLWLGILSTLVPFGIGALAAKGLQGTELYRSFVYTFLHLQYNGWFLFVSLGLFFKFLESKKMPFDEAKALLFFRLFTVSVIPAIGLSFLGMSFSSYFFIPSIIVSLIQLSALVAFMLAIKNTFRELLKQQHFWLKLFFIGFLLFFVLKTCVQSMSVLPDLKEIAFYSKHMILAYLHLSLIGVISFLLLGWLLELKWIAKNVATKLGALLLWTGFISTELLLLLAGLGARYSHIGTLIGSGIMAIGILLLLLSKVPQPEQTQD